MLVSSLFCLTALHGFSATCTHFGSAAGSLCTVVGPCPGEMRRHSVGGQIGPRGREPWEERPLASLVLEGNRLRLMSLQCMVGNYARCNENNKAGSIVVSKNTANAECLLGAFVCHLWVSALRPGSRSHALRCHTPQAVGLV